MTSGLNARRPQEIEEVGGAEGGGECSVVGWDKNVAVEFVRGLCFRMGVACSNKATSVGVNGVESRYSQRDHRLSAIDCGPHPQPLGRSSNPRDGLVIFPSPLLSHCLLYEGIVSNIDYV